MNTAQLNQASSETQNSSRTELGILDSYAKLLDSSIKIPGTRMSVGIEPFLNFIPLVGNASSLVMSLLLVLQSIRLGASAKLLFFMTINAVLDFLMGSIPVVGFLFDLVYKANERNVRLFRAYHDEGKYRGSVIPWLMLAGILWIGMILAMVYLVIRLVDWLI